MNKHPDFTLQALGKIGTPLASAIEAVPLVADDIELEAAKRMAQMLGQVVQMSIGLSGQIATPVDEADADSLRAGTAALSANLLANFYQHHEKLPEEQDISRITKALEAVLAFADNFSAAADQALGRLVTMGGDEIIFDKAQSSLVTLQSLTPVIAAISEFPFGLSETKLVQDVSTKLNGYVRGLVDGNDTLGQMFVFRSLAELYAQCHKAETARLASAQDDNRGELSIEPVWAAFEIRLAMVEAVLDIKQQSPVANAAPAAVSPPPVVAPDSESIAESAPTPAAPPSGGGPMGFFAGGGDTADKQPSEVEPSVPVEENGGEDEEEGEGKRGSGGGGGNKPAATNNQKSAPMSFFKPPSGGAGM